MTPIFEHNSDPYFDLVLSIFVTLILRVIERKLLNVITVGHIGHYLGAIGVYFKIILASPAIYRAGLFNGETNLVKVVICKLRSDQLSLLMQYY